MLKNEKRMEITMIHGVLLCFHPTKTRSINNAIKQVP
jgi:hypothetical protein